MKYALFLIMMVFGVGCYYSDPVPQPQTIVIQKKRNSCDYRRIERKCSNKFRSCRRSKSYSTCDRRYNSCVRNKRSDCRYW